MSHDNLTWTSTAIFSELIKDINIDCHDRILSYLPLSHIAGLVFDLITQVTYGSQVYFARPDALQGTLTLSLQWARPTYFFAVPRVWEKFEEKMKDLAASKPAIVQSISGWAKGLGAA